MKTGHVKQKLKVAVMVVAAAGEAAQIDQPHTILYHAYYKIYIRPVHCNISDYTDELCSKKWTLTKG